MVKAVFIRIIAVLIGFLCADNLHAKSDCFDFNKTLRVDFTLAGNAQYQSAFISRFISYQGWSGSENQLISPFNFGEYRVLIINPQNNDTIFRKGFSTLFEEWRTIDEAKEKQRAFEQSVILPMPIFKVLFCLDARQRNGVFKNIIQETINPQSLSIISHKPNYYPVQIIHGADSPANKVDLLFIADGYTKEETDKFFFDVTKLTRELFKIEPYKSNQDKFTVRALAVTSNHSGVNDPRAGISKNIAMRSSFNTFGVDRYLETEFTWSVFDFASQVAHDHIIVLVNTDKYGGGGIYNHFSVVAAGNRYSSVVLIHELGHGFAGLGDEYFGAEVSYNDYINQQIEPWQPNLTTLVDFESKWKNMVLPSTPIPTPVRPMYAEVTGVFEGGGYVTKGVFRPAVHCRMRTNEAKGFCKVCESVIIEKINFYTQ